MLRRWLVALIRRIVRQRRRGPGRPPFAIDERVMVDDYAAPLHPGKTARVLDCVYHAPSGGWSVWLFYEETEKERQDEPSWTICPAEYVRTLDPIRSLGRLAQED